MVPAGGNCPPTLFTAAVDHVYVPLAVVLVVVVPVIHTFVPDGMVGRATTTLPGDPALFPPPRVRLVLVQVLHTKLEPPPPPPPPVPSLLRFQPLAPPQ